MKNEKARDVRDSRDELKRFDENERSLALRPFFYGDEPSILDVIALTNLAGLNFFEEDETQPLQRALNISLMYLTGLVFGYQERSGEDWDEIIDILSVNVRLPVPTKLARPEDGSIEQASHPPNHDETDDDDDDSLDDDDDEDDEDGDDENEDSDVNKDGDENDTDDEDGVKADDEFCASEKEKNKQDDEEKDKDEEAEAEAEAEAKADESDENN